MKRAILMSLVSTLTFQATPALAHAADISATELSRGTKPVVWTLRAGSYSDRFLLAAPQAGGAHGSAAVLAPAKPALWTLRGGSSPELHQALAAAPVEPCWSEKAITRSLAPRCAPEQEEQGAAGREPRRK